MRKIQKLLSLLLAVLMLVSLVGCSGNDPDTTKPGQGKPSQVDKNLTVHENTYFTACYNENAGWTLADDDQEVNEGGGYAYLRILDDDGNTGLLVHIEAYEEDASSFRETLYANHVDMQAFVDGTGASETIGGLKMAAVDKQDGEWYFFGRNAEAGVSYTVHVTDWEDPNVPALIENITFTASATDNIDPPWPWEGEPFSGDTINQAVGSYTLSAQFLPMAEPLVTYETFDHDIAVVGDKLYLLSDCALYQYAYDGAGLSFVKQIPLEGEYAFLEKGADGNIILSSFMEPVVGHNGDAVQFSHEGPDKFAVAPGATWGISWFSSGEDCQLYAFHDGQLTGSPFPFPEVDSISHVSIDSQYIFVSGSSVADDEHYVFVYDYSGELQLQLGGEPDGFGLGSITYAVSTSNGFLGLDGNMREVVLWSTDGTWIGAVDDGDLFGTSYPWFAAADIADDGSILVVMSDTRTDESADEVLVFKLSGF